MKKVTFEGQRNIVSCNTYALAIYLHQKHRELVPGLRAGYRAGELISSLAATADMDNHNTHSALKLIDVLSWLLPSRRPQ